MADLTVVVGGSDTEIRSMMDRLKSDIKGKSAEMSKDFAGAFKNADTDATAALRKINAEYDKVRNTSTSTVADIIKAQQRWSADTTRLSTDVNAAHAAMGAATSGLRSQLTTMTAAAQGAGIQTGILGQVIGALTSPLGLAVVIFGALTLGISKATQAVLENARQVKELMAVSGLSADAADNLADTFQILGKDTNALTTSLFRMSGELDSGGEAFRNLGIEVRDNNGQLKMEGDLFLEVRDRISQYNSASVRASIAQDIFGRGARQLAEIFAMSREEYAKWSETAGKMSPWSQANQDAAKEYTRGINQLSMQVDAFWLALGTPIVSIGAAFFTWINAQIMEVREFDAALQRAEERFRWFVGIRESTIGSFEPGRDTLPEEGQPLAGKQAFDPTTLAKAARDQLHQLELQLKIIQATAADKPILALNQALEEFELKYGKAAATYAKTRIFDGLIKEAEAARALAIATRTFEGIALAAQSSAARATREIQVQMAQRLLNEEEGAIQSAEIQAEMLAKQLSALQDNLPKAIAAGPDARYAAEKAIAEKNIALADSVNVATVLIEKKATAEKLAQLVLRQTKEMQTSQQTLALAESQSARTLALLEMSGASEIEVAEAIYQNAVILATQRGALEQQKIQDEMARAKQTITIERDKQQKLLELSGQSMAVKDKINADILAADTARMRATVAAEQKMYDEIRAIERVERDKRAVIVEQTPRFQAMVSKDTIDRLKAMADEAETEEQLQELLTLIYIAESKKRTDALMTDSQRRLAADATEITEAASLRQREVDNWITKLSDVRTAEEKLASDILAIRAGVIDKAAAQLQRDVDNRIKINVEILSGVNKLAAAELAVAAGTVTGVLAERQKLIDNLNIIGDKERLFWEQGVAGAAAYAKSIGDVAGFFDATFTAALAAGTDKFSRIKTLAEGLAADLKSALGSFITDFKSNLDSGVGFWQSFTGALSSLWNNLMNSLIKRFADFLIDMAIRAATTQNAGGALGGLLALFAGSGAFAAQGGATSSSGQIIDLSGGESGVPGSAGGGNAYSTTYSLASTGVTLIGLASNLASSWQLLVGAFNTGLSSFQLAMNLNQSVITGLVNAGADIAAFAGDVAAASQTLQGLQAASPYITAAVAAVVIALTAMRDDITDTGKAVQSALTAVAAGLAIAGIINIANPIGWILLAAAAVVVVIGAILEWTGVFEKASKEWLQFQGKLSHTLGMEQAQLEIFGDALTNAVDLTGIATSIEDFRHSIENFAGVGGFFENTKGMGLFTVPGIPGATGNEHEGGIAFDFGPYIMQIQDAINDVLDSVRETISVKFADAAKTIMPADLFNAFKTGTLDPLRQAFEDLVTSADATIEDVKKFEERIKEVGDVLIAFAMVSAGLTQLGAAGKKILPDDLFAPLVKMGEALNQELIDLASSGKATTENLKIMAEAVDALNKLVVAFAQEALQLRELSAVAGEVLPSGLAESVVAIASTLREELVTLAESGKATAAELQALEAKIQALATGVALYQSLSTVIAGLTGDIDALTQASINNASAAISAADRAITDAQDMLVKAIDGPELAAAAVNLNNAIMAKYALEAKLIQDISKTISDILSGFGSQLMASAMVAVNFGLERGSTAALQHLLEALDGIQSSAFSATTRIWAAVQALNAIAAVIPSIVKAFGGAGSNPADLAMGIYTAALPSLTTIANLFGETLAAGDIRGALDLLNQGATAITALANAAITGVRQWEQAAVEAVVAGAQRQIDAENAYAQVIIDRINSTAQAAIDAINIEAAAKEKANGLAIDALNEQKSALQEANGLAIDALNEQKSALQEAIQLSQAWMQAAESLKDFIRGIELSTMAPPNPVGQMNLAQGFYSQAVAAYQGNATTENLAAVQKAAQQYLTALQGVYTRPDPRYAEIFNAIDAQLKAFQADAASRVTPAEEAAAQLKSIDTEIKRLNDETKAELKSIDAEIKRLNDETKVVRETAAAEVKEIEKTRDANTKAVEALRDANILAIETSRDLTIKGIHESAERTINGIKDAVGAIMGQIASEQFRLTGILIAQQEAIMKGITGGLPPAEWQMREQLAQRIALENLRDIVYAALMGHDIPAPPSSPAPIPGAARGVDILSDGLVYAHRGERYEGGQIHPATVAPYSGTRGSDTTVNVTVNVSGYGRGKDDLIRDVRKVVRDEVRGGVAGRMINPGNG